ncbi:hypothetical protein [Phyllobacterium myrsinacearum]|uniref:Uncharacterized protein n=1 Tax=Phyllobacterium myrsinacearum TaxID=28101 RepID=A0A839EJL9_9HYPH|nr:hypothetical protein [Phyllobacterium myrsinacearum]MBA8879052.1 hypothetical protein [Phyllobacterium myrsinacearum]
MPQPYADLTIAEVLSDPLINSVMTADHVTRKELELLMVSAARKNTKAAGSKDWARSLPAFSVDRSSGGGVAW